MKTLFAATAVAITLAGNLSAQVADIRDTDAAGYVVRAEAMLQSGNAAGAIDQLNSLERLQMKFPANTDLREKRIVAESICPIAMQRCGMLGNRRHLYQIVWRLHRGATDEGIARRLLFFSR